MFKPFAAIFLCLGFVNLCAGQDAVTAPAVPPSAAAPNSPAEIFMMAAQQSDIRSTGSQPFQLKATFTVVDDKGKSSAGEYSEIWIAKDRWRREVSYGPYKSSHSCVDGKSYLSALEKPMDFGVMEMMYNLKSHIPSTLDAAKVNDAWTARLEHVNGVAVVKVVPERPDALGDTPKTYLFSPGKPYPLGITSDYESTIYGKFRPTFGKLIPYEMVIHFANSKRSVDLNVSSLETATNPLDDSLVIPGASNGSCIEERSGEGRVIAGLIVKRVAPQYPLMARGNRGGTVVLHVTIGKDGKIKDVQVVSSPGSAFAESAVSAVKQYVYRPFLLDREPVEVDGTITINYSTRN